MVNKMILKFFIFSVTVSEMIDRTQGNIFEGWKIKKGWASGRQRVKINLALEQRLSNVLPKLNDYRIYAPIMYSLEDMYEDRLEIIF